MKTYTWALGGFGLAMALLLAGCAAEGLPNNTRAEAPPPARVEHEADARVIAVSHPEQFPLAMAGATRTAPELNVTGVVSPDISRNLPVVSLASGRVVEIRARLGDQVRKGQVLMRIQSADVSAAFSDYRKAQADETLARSQFDRASLLYERGAIAAKDLEVARDTDEKARVDVENARERLRVLGADIAHPSALVDVPAPASGIITEQNVSAAGGVKSLDNSPNLFTISDLSQVWVMCDVYENDLPKVHVGEFADVRLDAYPGRTFHARIDNVGPILDPAIRAAKVRLQMSNPGQMRVGMFVTATFHSREVETRAVVPAGAILHLHDRDWVYTPAGEGRFQRVAVEAGRAAADNGQEILSGLRPGDRVVASALVLENAAAQ